MVRYMNYRTRTRSAAAFSLIELVIVVVIIAIIAAIAIPRMSRGAAGAADSALSGNLRILRSAIELYATEHTGQFPPAASVVDALTKYSNEQGTSFQTTKDATHVFGPYLRAIPPLPVNCPRKGATGIATADAAGIGWIYDPVAGSIRANTTTEVDDKGITYSSY